MKKWIAVATLLVVVLTACRKQRSPDAGQLSGGPRQANAVAVRTEVLEQQDVDEFLTLPATVEAEDDTAITFRRAGQVVEILIREGQRVDANDLLVRLDDTTQKIDLQRAEDAYQQAEKDHQRMENLHASGSVSQQEYERSLSALNNARTDYNRSRDAWEDTQLRAPFKGTIESVDTRSGTYVSAGMKAAQLLSAGRLRARIATPESDVIYLQEGEKVIFTYQRFNTDALVFNGQISSIATQADSSSRTYKTLATIEATDQLRAGMVLTAKLKRRTYSQVIVIPLFALIPQQQGYTVFVDNDGEAEERQVEIGSLIKDRVIVTSGLRNGEELVVEGQQFLSNGAKLQATVAT